ncbi:hypothetical protein [Myxococcus sp. RHSTA-1-4]|uniref:hypothetical protein n=1 Tax=Myxococcus sp. RHSTA-1-4 TaxID=2874601 RepID=UPI001CBDB014|nr:hypothetical protein [Myxococcus sp. RHSTA-1-4]MBZ4420981.1 hypothetical protein [Myxococcus sp. RHSTA-1-4]
MRAFLLLALTLSAGSAAAAAPSGCQEDYSTCKEDCTIEYGGNSRHLKKLTLCFADCQENLDLCADRHSSLKGLPPGVAEDVRPRRRAEREEAEERKGKKKTKEEDPWADEAPAPARKRNPDDPFGYDEPANAKGGEGRRDSYRASESPKEEIPPAPDAAPVTGARATSSRAHAEESVSGASADGTQRTGYRASEAKKSPEVSLGLEDEEPVEGKSEPEPEPVAKKPEPKAAPVKEAPEAAASSEEKDPLLDSEPAVLAAPPPTKKPATTTAPQRPAPPPEPKKDISEWDPNGD